MSESGFHSERPHDIFSPEKREELDSIYWHRPMLSIPNVEYGGGPQLSILTYNLLSPFDEKKYACKKYTREQVLVLEIAGYNADIVCLQEVDNNFKLAEELTKYGYIMRTMHPNKHHSIAIAFKYDLFQEAFYHSILFPYGIDESPTETSSGHGVFFLCLQFKPKFLENHKNVTRSGIIVGTTHLSSKGVKSYNRARDAARILEAVGSLTEYVQRANNAPLKFYTFIAGDFNSTPEDAGYLSLVHKPVKYGRWAHDTLVRSVNSNRMGAENDRLRERELSAKLPETLSKIGDLEDLHNKIKKRAFSLYSVGYSHVHEANTHPQSKEPWFSYWGEHTHELLDYLFVISDWDGEETGCGQLAEFSEKNDMKLLALLGMPAHNDMDSARPQPKVGEFPSDHLCIMADLELL